MNQTATRPAAKVDLRQQMPMTAKWIEAKRAEWGAAYVNGCLRRALAGEPGAFYAIESGHVWGTPFPGTHPIAKDQEFAVLVGSTFAVFMAQPEAGASNGAH